MKKILSLVLVLMFVLSAFGVSAFAAEERAYVTLERTSLKGISHAAGYYHSEKRLEEMPTTFEAWVYIPKDVYTKRGGIILGNGLGHSRDDVMSFEIHEKGVPRLQLCSNENKEYDYKFTKAAVPADKWTHVAIVYGTGTDNKQIFCYINGEFKEATEVSAFYETSERVTENVLCLAGDNRSLNEQGFRGRLGDVVIYSDVRTAEEIASDAKNKPDTADEELMMYFDMSSASDKANIADASGNGYDMIYDIMWPTAAEMKAARADDKYEYTYSIAFLPDPQYTTRIFPKKLPDIFDWLIENKEKKNIQYLIGLGDMTDQNGEIEWQAITKQYKRLEGVLDYSLVRGNHDITKNGSAKLYDKYYNSSSYYYKHVKENGGMQNETTTRNSYLLFEVGEVKYMILNIDFGAMDDVLAWADEVLSANTDRRVIVATHGFTHPDGGFLCGDDYGGPSTYNAEWNDADDMWEKCFKKHANIQMIVSGHMAVDDIVCTKETGDNGNIVYRILMDPQTTDNMLGGMGVVGMMYFTEDGNHAKVEYYSTVFKKYFKGGNNAISLHFVPEEEETESVDTSVLDPDCMEQPADSDGGCGSSVAIMLPTLFVATTVSVVAVRKKKKED